jgi:hypothetical protein
MVLREVDITATMRIGLCRLGMDMAEEAVVVGVIDRLLLLLLLGRQTSPSLAVQHMVEGEDVPDQQAYLVALLLEGGDEDRVIWRLILS